MLEIRGLSKSFGGVKATDNVSLDFADGSLTAVIGPNGAGKSTFFNLITGALRPDAGQIMLNGVELAGRSPPDRPDKAPSAPFGLPGETCPFFSARPERPAAAGDGVRAAGRRRSRALPRSR